MNWSLWIFASNCCPIEECKQECLMLGHPTWLGVIIAILFCAFIITIIKGWRDKQ
jgi:hypothetical protein